VPPDPLAELSLEQLLDVEVQSVSRRDERVFDAPAAVYVLTSADLRRAGVASIPEALRLVPGLFVGQVNASQWAIGSRGFAGLYTNKLLVLVDGRTVYSRLFAGVFWEEENIPIEEVERLEVIRGPGATLWGANAVNGIINVVTKAGGGEAGSVLQARVGRAGHQQHFVGSSGRTDGGLGYRAFGSYKGADAFAVPGGTSASDDFDPMALSSRFSHRSSIFPRKRDNTQRINMFSFIPYFKVIKSKKIQSANSL